MVADWLGTSCYEVVSEILARVRASIDPATPTGGGPNGTATSSVPTASLSVADWLQPSCNWVQALSRRTSIVIVTGSAVGAGGPGATDG